MLRVHHQQQGRVPPSVSRSERCSVLCAPHCPALPWDPTEPRASLEPRGPCQEAASRKLEVSHRSSKRKSRHFAPRNKAAGQPRALLAEGLCWRALLKAPAWLLPAWGEEGPSWRPVAAAGAAGAEGAGGLAGRPGKLCGPVAETGPPCEEAVLWKDSCSSVFYKFTMSTSFLTQCGCLLQMTANSLHWVWWRFPSKSK